jgi:methylenetetrahydrofolate reductase (NADPH)
MVPCSHINLLCVGFAVYPDGHPTIASDDLFRAALKKQTLLSEHNVQGRASTQICFNPSRTLEWIEGARKAGFYTPIELGLPGAALDSFVVFLNH